VEIEPFAEIAKPDLETLHRDAADVERFLAWGT
jgi:hypothetical protein